MSERRYIPFPEKLASALACLLPQEQRDALRADKVGSQFILNLFQFDHIVLHAQGGADNWWNLDPKQIAEHREKSKRDTAIVAKSKRIVRKQEAHKAKLIAISGHMNEPALYRELVRKGRIRPTTPWAIEAVKWERPKRRIPSRPFPNKKRKFANRNGK